MQLLEALKCSIRCKRNNNLAREEIQAMQRKKFLRLVKHVSRNSRYYQRVIRKNNIDISSCTPEDFPVLTKEMVLENFDEIVSDRQISKEKLANFLAGSRKPQDLFLHKYYVIHTSGSSGTVSYYVYSKKEFLQGIIPATRSYELKLFRKMAYVAATRGHFMGVTMADTAMRWPLLYKDGQLLDINSPFGEIVSGLNQMQPTVLSGYAFALRKLAEAQREGRLHIQPTLLQSGGEPLSTEDKEYIQDTFKASLVNTYASSEHCVMGIGADKYEGMYLMEDNLIFEIHPRFVNVTNLFNYTLPLIRYRMPDQLEVVEDTTGKLPFRKIKEIVGRNESVPVFLNDQGIEDFISPLLLVEFYVKNLNRFQIQLLDKQAFVFKACLAAGLSDEEKGQTVQAIKERMSSVLAEKLMTQVVFRVELVNDLWADPQTGKFKLITNAVQPDLTESKHRKTG
jgi:phenylacetate-coenzyme A ligase PaaK-like adenylate-forming protein